MNKSEAAMGNTKRTSSESGRGGKGENLPAALGEMNEHDEVSIERDEVLGWIEFGCWTALALTPFLYWVNGPAVSQDQLVVRWAVVIIAIVGGAGLRLRYWRRRSDGHGNSTPAA